MTASFLFVTYFRLGCQQHYSHREECVSKMFLCFNTSHHKETSLAESTNYNERGFKVIFKSLRYSFLPSIQNEVSEAVFSIRSGLNFIKDCKVWGLAAP